MGHGHPSLQGPGAGKLGGLVLHPAPLNFNAVQDMEKVPGGRGAEMLNQIDLQVSRCSHVPMVRLHPDQMTHVGARADGATEAA